MEHLYEKLRNDAENWRKEGYPCSEYPLIEEILNWQFDSNSHEQGQLKYLREPQFYALEIYWYLRLVRDTPHIVELYKDYYSDNVGVFCGALGIPMSPGELQWVPDIESVLKRVSNDEEFVKQKQIYPVHEAVTLNYPSYIFALAMGTGKTTLIGTIIATEFAMAFRYPDSDFMKNALVFAPGTTIIGSLRKIGEVPYDMILPTSLHQEFMGNRKFAPVAAKDMPVQRGSVYNIIVTNTEKIILRKSTKKKNDMFQEYKKKNKKEQKDKQAELEANHRLEKIVSLPNLGVFSDEAHHTYGNRIDKELKRVRDTVNYINKETSLIGVVNTTGTPYSERQMLREVVAWYSLGEGINDNILKSLHKGIIHYPIASMTDEDIIRNVINDFFENYKDVALPDGAKAKIAFYFRTEAHLQSSKILIENMLTEIGESHIQILVNTQTSSKPEINEFERINDPNNQKRIILLIAKGVEGWDCPSLFACALIKKQTTSSNFVLQSSTRCLRQVKGNSRPARIYLDTKNRDILDKELEENFGTSISKLRGEDVQIKEVIVRVRKTELPKLKISRWVSKVIWETENATTKIQLSVPTSEDNTSPIYRNIVTPDFTRKGTTSPLVGVGDRDEVDVINRTTDCYTFAQRVATNYHLSVKDILKKLKQLYPDGEVPNKHIYHLYKQVESQLQNYREGKEMVTEELALIRVHDDKGNALFEKDEGGNYFHRLRLKQSTYDRMQRDRLLFDESDLEDRHDISYHYTPYDFDSTNERGVFETILTELNFSEQDVEMFLFTGGLTDPRKTDFHFQYKGVDGIYHHYFPDFVIVKDTKKFYIVEIKSKKERDDATVAEKRKAVEWLKDQQPDELFDYSIIYTEDALLSENPDLHAVLTWMKNDQNTQNSNHESTSQEEETE